MNTIYWISLGLICLGFILFIALTFIKRNKRRGIRHYENVRDNLTIRNPEAEEPEEDNELSDATGSTGGLLSRLIGAFVAVLVGVSLIGPITSQVNLAANMSNIDNVTGIFGESVFAGTFLKMVPMFFAIGICGIGIAIAYGALRDAGVLDGGSDDEEKPKKKKGGKGIKHYTKMRDEMTTRNSTNPTEAETIKAVIGSRLKTQYRSSRPKGGVLCVE